MTDIALSTLFEHSSLSEMFSRTLSGMQVVLVAIHTLGAVSEVPRSAGSGFLSFSALDGIYPFGIGLYDWPQSVEDGVLVALARHLSEHLNCDAICDGTAYGDGSHPYFSLLWRSGEAWLADDSGADPYDGTGEPVRPIRRLTQPLPWLAQNGEILLR